MAASSRRLTACASAFYLGSSLFLGAGMTALVEQPLHADEPLSGPWCDIPYNCTMNKTGGVCSGSWCGTITPLWLVPVQVWTTG